MKAEKAFSVIGALSWVAYGAAHILAAVTLFKSVKLWAFLVMLFVPGLGDVMAITTLIKVRYYLPLIVYGVAAVVWLVVYIAAIAKGNKIRKGG